MAAKNKFLNAMKMPSIDDMFSSEADRQRESGDLVTEVPLSELHPFVGHPFEVRDDEEMPSYRSSRQSYCVSVTLELTSIPSLEMNTWTVSHRLTCSASTTSS